jgi:Lipopolysaccharide-assembly
MFGRFPQSIVSRRSRTPRLSRRAVLLNCLAVACAASSGCGYSFRAPYDKSVQTVFVPIFKTQAFIRDAEKDLTRQVQQEITRRTPYRLVHRLEEADTVLSGTINYIDKNIMVEAPTNLPRQLTRTINVSVNWVHNPPTEAEKKRPPTIVSETLNFVPEVGETALTATTKVNLALAKQIVDMMEQPWFTEEDLR